MPITDIYHIMQYRRFVMKTPHSCLRIQNDPQKGVTTKIIFKIFVLLLYSKGPLKFFMRNPQIELVACTKTFWVQILILQIPIQSNIIWRSNEFLRRRNRKIWLYLLECLMLCIDEYSNELHYFYLLLLLFTY